MVLKTGERINNLRVQQARDAGADTIVTGCGYCKQLLEPSVTPAALASLVVRSLPARPAPAESDDARPQAVPHAAKGA